MRTKAENMRDLLTATGAYTTPADLRRSLAARCLGWLDAWYYLQLVRVLHSGSRSVRRGTFTGEVWFDHGMWTLRVVEACGGRVTFEGFENVMGVPGPFVYISNHMSLLETLLLPASLSLVGPVTPVVKESLLDYPMLGWVLKEVKAIAVTRRNPREDLQQVLRRGTESLERGVSVVLFPQATRSVELDLSAFNSLGVKLAARAGVRVVPVALRTDFHGNGRRFKDMGPIDRSRPVRIRIGSPIVAAGRTREAHAEVLDFVSGALTEWGMPVIAAKTAAAGEE